MARKRHGAVSCLTSQCVAKGSSVIAAGFQDGSVQLWTLRGARFNGSLSANLCGDRASGLAVCGGHLAVASGNRITVFDVMEDSLNQIAVHELSGACTSVCCAESEGCFYIGQGPEVMRLDPTSASPQPVCTMQAPVICLANHGDQLIVADAGGSVSSVSLQSTQDCTLLAKGLQPVLGVATLPEYDTLLVCDASGPTFAGHATRAEGADLSCKSFAQISASGKLFAVPTSEIVQLWRVDSDMQLVPCCSIQSNNGEVSAATGCGDHLIMGCQNGAVLMAHFTQNTSPAISLDNVFLP